MREKCSFHVKHIDLLKSKIVVNESSNEIYSQGTFGNFLTNYFILFKKSEYKTENVTNAALSLSANLFALKNPNPFYVTIIT